MSTTRTPILQLHGATKQYKGVVAVSDISFDVYSGEIAGLIGPNGAGKTTLINMITGTAVPTQGTITFESEILNGIKPHKISAKGIARTFQIVRPFTNLSVVENVAVGAMFGAGGRKRSIRESFSKADEILDLVQLSSRRDDPADSLTITARKRLEMAKALAMEPKLLLLDEVMAGLSGAEMGEATDLIRLINQRGVTILMIEHVMRVIMSVCDRVIVLDYGKKIAEGTPSEITKNPAVIAAYLGRKRTQQDVQDSRDSTHA
jgi:branched-chain amino acid transport system ATP-binding protein